MNMNIILKNAVEKTFNFCAEVLSEHVTVL